MRGSTVWLRDIDADLLNWRTARCLVEARSALGWAFREPRFGVCVVRGSFQVQFDYPLIVEDLSAKKWRSG